MKRLVILVGIIVALGALTATWLVAATPTIGATAASPSTITVGTSTTVTFTAVITDPTVIPTGVNLIRLPNGTGSPTVVGRLTDDGANGDVTAGDGIFTGQITLNEVSAGTVQFEVSAAFRRVLRRVISPAISITANPQGATLPPDPGEAGKATLSGIDSDHDGVRDDVQRWIALTYPNSAKERAALTQGALAIQVWIASGGNSTQTDIQKLSRAIDCIDYSFMASSTDIDGGINANEAYNSLEQLALNTPARIEAFYRANDQARFL